MSDCIDGGEFVMHNNAHSLIDGEITKEASVSTFQERAGEGLWLSHKSIGRHIDAILGDTPDVDGGDFYTVTGSGYAGWRDGIPGFSTNYLRGFRDGVNHVGRVVLNGGGSSAAGVCQCNDDEDEATDVD